jgi:hypothetical protein
LFEDLAECRDLLCLYVYSHIFHFETPLVALFHLSANDHHEYHL